MKNFAPKGHPQILILFFIKRKTASSEGAVWGGDLSERSSIFALEPMVASPVLEIMRVRTLLEAHGY